MKDTKEGQLPPKKRKLGDDDDDDEDIVFPPLIIVPLEKEKPFAYVKRLVTRANIPMSKNQLLELFKLYFPDNKKPSNILSELVQRNVFQVMYTRSNSSQLIWPEDRKVPQGFLIEEHDEQKAPVAKQDEPARASEVTTEHQKRRRIDERIHRI